MPHCVPPETDQDLRVGGFQPFTSLDFPGHLSAVVFCQGCPLSCVYCHNQDLLPVASEGQYSWQYILAHLESRKGLLDAVVFSGGEPLMQAALEPVIRQVRSLGYKIGLHTAGTAPSRLHRLLPYLDWVGLDIKAMPQGYASLTGVANAGSKAWQSLDILVGSDVDFEVRTTIWPETFEAGLNAGDITELAKRLRIAGVKSFALQEARDPQTTLPLRGDVVMDQGLLSHLAATFDSFDLRRAA